MKHFLYQKITSIEAVGFQKMSLEKKKINALYLNFLSDPVTSRLESGKVKSLEKKNVGSRCKGVGNCFLKG